MICPAFLAGRPKSATSGGCRTLLDRMRHYFEESEGSSAHRRIHADLAGENVECSPGLVRHIMRD